MWDLHNNEHLIQVISLYLIAYLIYFLTFKYLNFEKLNFKKIFLAAVFIYIFFLPIPYLTSDDLFSYIFTGRVFSVWEENPYLAPYDDFQHDPYYSQLKTVWSVHVPYYGPLFILISGIINFVGQNSLGFLIYLFKFIFILFNLLSIYLVYKISKNLKSVFLFGFNPLIIFELSGNTHSESLIILLLLLSIYQLKKPLVGFSSFLLSGLIKYYTFIFMPLYLIIFLKKGRSIFLAGVWGIVLMSLIFLPFLNAGGVIFNNLSEFYCGKFNYPSVGIFLGERIFNSYNFSFQINTLIFLLALLLISIKFWFRKFELKIFIFYMGIIYFIFILTKLSLVLGWYLTPLVAISSLLINYREYKKYATLGIIFVSFYSLIIYYAVR